MKMASESESLTYTCFFPFGGIGAGARGFLDAQLKATGVNARFESIGGIDFDAAACRDFEYLTGSPSLCADIAALTVERLVQFAGKKAPDVVFMSPPCKGASGLLSQAKSETEKYKEMNRLALRWITLMMRAWGDAPPRLVLLENVPRLTTRAAAMLKDVRKMLTAAGYVCSDGYHDCGELGGLAQHRRRYLLVARHAVRAAPILYQPMKKRVRACGEVLGPLPMPGDAAAGPMHILPRISWLNWVRLALIPAGGDWRDLPGVLDKGQPRREKFKRHRMEQWSAPVGTVGGSGSNAAGNVADPRPGEPWGGGRLGVVGFDQPAGAIQGESLPTNGRFAVADPRAAVALPPNEGRHWNKYAVGAWDEPARTVIGAIQPGSGGPAVADPRVALDLNPDAHTNLYAVGEWDKPARAVTGASRPGGGAASVADPRVAPETGYANSYRVNGWDAPAPTVTAGTHPSNGGGSVADPRPGAFGNVDKVTDWGEPMHTVTSSPAPSSGAGAVADPRQPEWFRNVLGVIPWTEPAGTVTGNGRPGAGKFSVADPRVKAAFDHGYAVLDFAEPSPTVAAGSHPGQGAYSVADPRIALTCTPRERSHAYGVIPWSEAAKTVTGHGQIDNGAFAVADPRLPDAPPVMVISDPRKPPPQVPVIIAEDGTWHRPLTTLELAALQGLPTTWNGKPLKLDGDSSSAWRERIGNAVPPPAGKAIAERMLLTLVQADTDTFALSSVETSVWVEPEAMPS